MFSSRVFNYLNYILLPHHRGGHGIHSPFVFDLVSRVFRNKTDPAIVLLVEQIRKQMLSDKRIINVRDLGSGSASLKKSMRKVSEIARRSPVTPKYGRLLSNIAAEFGKPAIIELGTSVGISAIYMAASCPDATVYTIEGCPETAKLAKQNFVNAGFENIKMMEGSFDDILPELLSEVSKPGLVFIDGNHRKEPVMKYFNLIAENSGNSSVVIIDDINHSKEMNEAWHELKKHEKVSLSIDLFRMGILFFREGINHNDYTIRY